MEREHPQPASGDALVLVSKDTEGWLYLIQLQKSGSYKTFVEQPSSLPVMKSLIFGYLI